MEKVLENSKRKKLNFTTNNDVQTGLLITFEEPEGEEPEGKVFNVHIPYGVRYWGLGDLFLKMERIYNLLGKPQEEFMIRSEAEARWKDTPLENAEEWNFREDCFQNFQKVYIGCKRWIYTETMFRRHGSWQGLMRSGPTGSLYYRSSLELLHYIDGYLAIVDKK